MNVFYTVDTEFHPLDGNWRAEDTERLIARDIDGFSPQGPLGTFYQSRILREHGLKGVFFLEALAALAVGNGYLRRIIDRVQADGHEIALHLHPEWLRRAKLDLLGGKTGNYMNMFSVGEQEKLIRCGVRLLRENGAKDVVAFRAGAFGANEDTLIALRRCGLAIDSSYNLGFTTGRWKISGGTGSLQPFELNSVLEHPVSVFKPPLGGLRPAQLCAISTLEMRTALNAAHVARWNSFVIVSHSFELINRARTDGQCWSADNIVQRRFLKMCRFLADNRHQFTTRGFADVDNIAAPSTDIALRGSPRGFAIRLAEQLMRKL
jgi:peptidoglycan/xylan/chitin deacetylase (PgdA/CDA1 family)